MSYKPVSFKINCLLFSVGMSRNSGEGELRIIVRSVSEFKGGIGVLRPKKRAPLPFHKEQKSTKIAEIGQIHE
jgi:hypothetical protein